MAGGKFKKPQRGGGRTFSRRIEAVHTNGVSAYRDREESGDSSAESSEASESGSGSESESEEEVVAAKKPANAASIDVSNPNRAAGSRVMKASDLTTPIEMSRKEREAAEKEAAKQKYWKLHQEGKTDQAKADMARLAVIRQKREEAAAQRLAEAQGKEKEKTLWFGEAYTSMIPLFSAAASKKNRSILLFYYDCLNFRPLEY
ncbi:unnamed protein product [Mortierella alpina]